MSYLESLILTTKVTNEYLVGMDVIKNFIREWCVQRTGCSIRVRELFKCHQDWCDENSEHACSEQIPGVTAQRIGDKPETAGGWAVLARPGD
jgi:hypothetical protein